MNPPAATTERTRPARNRRAGSGLALALLICVSALAAPATATAAIGCTVTTGAGGELTVEISAGTSQVSIVRGSLSDPDEISVRSGGVDGAEQACAGGPATIDNIDAIQVEDQVAGQSTTAMLGLAGGALGPGVEVEAGASEIEFTFNGGDGTADQFWLFGSSGPDDYRFGVDGAPVTANLNADGDIDDLSIDSAELMTVETDDGADTVDTSGGAGFTGPVPYDAASSAAVRLDGGAGDDVLTAGSGSSFLDGGANGDVMTGGAGNDEIELGTLGGDDTATGGGGSDFANYQFASTGALTVDLRTGGPQDTGIGGTDTISGFEGLVGANTAGGTDLLIGDGGPNGLFSQAGDDTMVGLGGDDELSGAGGQDTASFAGASAPVSFDLGVAVPQATGGAGTDTASSVENLIDGPFADDLTGDGNDNVIDVHDGLADTVDCVLDMTDDDELIADEVGLDTHIFCEQVDNSPQTSLVSEPPPGTLTTRTPSYSLSADEPAQFELSLDGGAFSACAATCVTPPLADGVHTLVFRAIDADEHGLADLTPVTRNVTVDATPPDTTASGRTKLKTKKKRVRVSFKLSASEASSFECSLDVAGFTPCVSPFSALVKRGVHTLGVRARDAAGNLDATPASIAFRVVKKKAKRKK